MKVPGRIAIFGASGFVGSTLCERLHFEGGCDFTAIIRSSGNAARIARLALPLRIADLLDQAQVAAAVKDCDIVVNCTMGNDAAMSRGFRNLVEAARQRRPAKFIHLSSISIYGEDPAANSTNENGAPNPGGNPYGISKLRQDQMVMDLHGSGVPCYILCPGNITGPYSLFLRGLIDRLQRGPIPLVDEGSYASNLIHVDNLVEAILCTLCAEGGSGERYFVNETQPVSWRRLFDDCARRLNRAMDYVPVSRTEVLPLLASKQKTPGIKDHFRIALSGEFRRGLSLMPVFQWVNRTAADTFERLPPERQQRIKERLRWPIRVEQADSRPTLDDRYVKVQVRQYYHSPQKLADRLGWKPPLTYERGLETSLSWAEFAGIL